MIRVIIIKHTLNIEKNMNKSISCMEETYWHRITVHCIDGGGGGTLMHYSNFNSHSNVWNIIHMIAAETRRDETRPVNYRSLYDIEPIPIKKIVFHALSSLKGLVELGSDWIHCDGREIRSAGD